MYLEACYCTIQSPASSKVNATCTVAECGVLRVGKLKNKTLHYIQRRDTCSTLIISTGECKATTTPKTTSPNRIKMH